MLRTYRFTTFLLSLWLIGWIFLSWPAIQDDALIHLRYADNLYLHHFITYDGVHPDYGASSLLYVGLLGILRGITPSPNLPRATSSVAHLLLFAALALAFAVRLPRSARLARVAALVLLCLLAAPSAVRWLDDGMETGIVLLFVSLLACLIHDQTKRSKTHRAQYLLLVVVAFFAVLLRTELMLLCVIGSLIPALCRSVDPGTAPTLRNVSWRRLAAVAPGCGHLILGGTLALGFIVATMHVLLPDTAIAKSLGIGFWFNVFEDTGTTLGGAFAFGMGMLLFWLLTMLLTLLPTGRFSLTVLLGNTFFPIALTLSSLRGQEIQGVRYFAWTLLFSIVWNILNIAHSPSAVGEIRRDFLLVYAFLAVLAVDLPFESIAMHRVLSRRAGTMRLFEEQHLDVLRSRRGVAFDIGYIGYFSKAEICDLAGLVNGRAAARLSSIQRADACVQRTPDFLFVNASQLGPMAARINMTDWRVCGRYDFTNVRTLDSHYLIVPPSLAGQVCEATGATATPSRALLASATASR